MKASKPNPSSCRTGQGDSGDQKNQQQAEPDQDLEQGVVSQSEKTAADAGNFEFEDGLFRRFDGKLVPEIAGIHEFVMGLS